MLRNLACRLFKLIPVEESNNRLKLGMDLYSTAVFDLEKQLTDSRHEIRVLKLRIKDLEDARGILN